MTFHRRILRPGELPQFVKDASFPPELHRDVFTGQPAFTEEEIPGQLAALASHRGKFCTNNSMLAYVDLNGNPYCVPRYAFKNTPNNPMQPGLEARLREKYGENGEKIVSSLKAAGYEYGSFYVPHSNDGGVWGWERARELARREGPDEVLPLEFEPTTPERLAEVGLMEVRKTEKDILDQIRVPGAIEVNLEDLKSPPPAIKFLNPAIEDARLRELLHGKSSTMVLINVEPAGGVVENLKNQLGFYRDQLQPCIKDASAGVKAVEVVHTKACVGLSGFVEKFVLDRNGDIIKVTGGQVRGMVVDLSSKRTVKLTPDGQFYVQMEDKPLI